MGVGHQHVTHNLVDESNDGTSETDPLVVRVRLRNPRPLVNSQRCHWILVTFLLVSGAFLLMLLGSESSAPQYNLSRTGLTSERQGALDAWFDCHPGPNGTEEACIERGCTWSPDASVSSGQPSCYFPRNFTYYEWGEPRETVMGLEVKLRLVKEAPYPRNVKELILQVHYETERSLRIKIYDSNSARYEVPLPYKTYERKSSSFDYSVELFKNGFQIYRSGSQLPLVDTTLAPLVYSDQFLEISSTLPSTNVYGLAESVESFRRNLNWTRTVIWANPKPTLLSSPTGNNSYSAHPFYFVFEEAGNSHGVFLANSNAMEVILQPRPAVTFRTIGGILDFRIFIGPSPSEVIQQFTDVIGKPHLPPYWALGFHLCRSGYNNLDDVEAILQRNLEAGVPIEAQWLDIDYMQHDNNFAIDPVNFGKLPQFVKKLHDLGMHFVPTVSAGISGGELPGAYPPFDDGLKENIFVKDFAGRLFKGKVWNPVSTVWPDYSNPNVTSYWTAQLKRFHLMLPFDGTWLDENEPSNYLNETVPLSVPREHHDVDRIQHDLHRINHDLDRIKQDLDQINNDLFPIHHGQDRIYLNPGLSTCWINSSLDYPPYIPHLTGGTVHYKTICASCSQNAAPHYDIHNIFGTMESMVTYQALLEIRGERPFIVSRSTFPGHGQFGGHWTGDIFSLWDQMRQSIPQILNSGLFGIPLVGADICGYNSNTTIALCRRWQQLGAFYPFARNHNAKNQIAQDPASLGPAVIEATKETLKVRYSLLPYIYTLFFNAYLTGIPVVRPMFFEFPNDTNTYPIDTQFMLGPIILIVPVLFEEFNSSTIDAYLPRGKWYQHYYNASLNSTGEVKKVTVPDEFNSIPILYRAGTILVKQKPGITLKESRSNKFSVYAYLDLDGSAKGELYWDDGVTPSPQILQNYNHYLLEISSSAELKIIAEMTKYSGANMSLESIEIRGILGDVVSNVTINNGVYWPNFTFDIQSQILVVDTDQKNVTFTHGLELKWTVKNLLGTT